MRQTAYALLAVIATYTIAYSAVVEPLRIPFASASGRWPVVPHYRVGGQIAEFIFTPGMVIEKNIFPSRWGYINKELTDQK